MPNHASAHFYGVCLLVRVVFEVDKLVIAYVMQLWRIEGFGISRRKWNRLFKGVYDEKDELAVKNIRAGLKQEYATAEKLKKTVERNGGATRKACWLGFRN